MGKGFFLKFKIEYKPILQNIQKYKDYMNAIYPKTHHPFYIEVISDGFLLVYESFESYCAFRKNAEKTHNSEKNAEKPPSHLLSIFLSDNITKETFPKKGITFIVEVQEPYVQKVFAILQIQYKSRFPDISIQLGNQSDIWIFFPTYETVREYALAMSRFTHSYVK